MLAGSHETRKCYAQIVSTDRQSTIAQSAEIGSSILAINRFMKRKTAFGAALFALLLCGIFRSAIATRLDSFDLDEAYHITAGVTYARLGDYRLNPEHPPLIKLWVGSFLTADIFKTPEFRPLADKWDERHYTNEVVYTQNDPDVTQKRARIAMFALNGILLLAF